MRLGRRGFIAKAGGAMTGVAAAMVEAPNVIAQPKVQWRMSTAFTAVFDIHHGVAQRLAKVVEETSGGRFRIEVFPAGQILPPFDCFDAASQGKIPPAAGLGTQRSQEAVGRGRPRGFREDPHGRKVHASFTKFQALVGPWNHVAEGAYHRFVGS
jgi:hypothetical protein